MLFRVGGGLSSAGGGASVTGVVARPGVGAAVWTGPAPAASITSSWWTAYNLASGNPAVVMDFVGNQYASSGSSVALSSLITNAGSISAAGMALSTTNITAAGALLAALQTSAWTAVAETSGGTNSAFAGIVSFDALPAPLFRNNDNKLRSYQPNIVDTGNTADWTGTVYSGIANNASGVALCLNAGTVATGTDFYTAPTAVTIGQYGGGLAFGGRLRRLLVWTRKLSNADLQKVTAAPPYA